MSLTGSERRGGDVPETGSPAVVVHQEVGDDLAALQIETVEVRQSVEVAALEHGTALARVVEADHGGQEHAFAAAQDAERSEEHTSELQSLMRISYAVFCLKKKK